LQINTKSVIKIGCFDLLLTFQLFICSTEQTNSKSAKIDNTFDRQRWKQKNANRYYRCFAAAKNPSPNSCFV